MVFVKELMEYLHLIEYIEAKIIPFVECIGAC